MIFFWKKSAYQKACLNPHITKGEEVVEDQADEFQETYFGTVDQSNKEDGRQGDWTTTRSTK